MFTRNVNMSVETVVIKEHYRRALQFLREIDSEKKKEKNSTNIQLHNYIKVKGGQEIDSINIKELFLNLARIRRTIGVKLH